MFTKDLLLLAGLFGSPILFVINPLLGIVTLASAFIIGLFV